VKRLLLIEELFSLFVICYFLHTQIPPTDLDSVYSTSRKQPELPDFIVRY